MTTLSQPLKVATALERRQRQGNVTNVMKVREVKPAKKKDLSELLGCCGNKMNSRQGSIHSNFIEFKLLRTVFYVLHIISLFIQPSVTRSK